jgi:Protein of unknown function (DUF1638)
MSDTAIRQTGTRSMRLRLITCDILARPAYLCAARSPHIVDVAMLPRGLHADAADLRSRLQAAIDETGPGYDAIVLGYGLCGGATAGLRAREVRLVLPRAHDCVTLFLGSRERYRAETEGDEPTYWYVHDQLERGSAAAQGSGGGATGSGARSVATDPGAGADTDDQLDALRAAYVERYGEDNADYLMEVMGAWRDRYRRAAFISLGVTDESAAETTAREQAERRGWQFERLEGSLVLLRRLIDGDWDENVLILEPGQVLAMSYDDDVVRAIDAVPEATTGEPPGGAGDQPAAESSPARNAAT